jgi:polysaccharide deacetylase family protein (PEP-CTERM system associated)
MHPHPTVNVMTVDVEDYFHVSAFESVVSRDRWADYESRVSVNTERVLELLADAGVTATFFVLGWVADRHPAIVRRIAAAGHELASHSYWHRLVYDLTREAFREDLRRAKAAIEAVTGTAVRGFRAPSFSITERSLWAIEVLVEEGYDYDASIFPIRPDRYGIPTAPRQPHRLAGRQGSLLEVPSTATSIGGVTVPVGGGYFRLLPYAATRAAIERCNTREGRPAVFYVHPWEFDPEQPRMAAPLVSRLRHYAGLSKTARRFRRLLRDFRFGSIEAVLLREPLVGSAPGKEPVALSVRA